MVVGLEVLSEREHFLLLVDVFGIVFLYASHLGVQLVEFIFELVLLLQQLHEFTRFFNLGFVYFGFENVGVCNVVEDLLDFKFIFPVQQFGTLTHDALQVREFFQIQAVEVIQLQQFIVNRADEVGVEVGR